MTRTRAESITARILALAALGVAAVASSATGVRAAETVVTSGGTIDCRNPQWRPDGEWILYQATKPSDPSFHQIRKVKPDGTGDMLVVENASLRPGSARFSPVTDNGSSPRYWIAYAAGDPDQSDAGRIFVVRDRNPGEVSAVVRQRTQDPFATRDHGAPRWSPDGAFLVFEYSPLPGAGRVAVYRAYSSLTFEHPSPASAAALPRDIFPLAMERSEHPQNGTLRGDLAVRHPVYSPNGAWISAHRRIDGESLFHRVQRIDPLGHAFGYPDDGVTLDVSPEGVVDPSDPGTVIGVEDAFDAEWRPVSSDTFIACVVRLAGETDTEIAWFAPTDDPGTVVTRNGAPERAPSWNIGDGPLGCRFIAFVRENATDEIWVVHQDPADGEFKVSVSAVDHDAPSFSPANASHVAYQKRVFGRWQIAWAEAFCPIH